MEWNGLAVVALQSCSGRRGICQLSKDYGVDEIYSENTLDFEEFNSETEYEDYEAACLGGTAGMEGASFCEAWISITYNHTAFEIPTNENIQIKGFPMCYAPSCNYQFDEPLADELLLSLIETFFISGVEDLLDDGGRRLATQKLNLDKGGTSAVLSRVLQRGTIQDRDLKSEYDDDDYYNVNDAEIAVLRFECKSMNSNPVSSQAPTKSPVVGAPFF
jgi:hypothetical protein